MQESAAELGKCDFKLQSKIHSLFINKNEEIKMQKCKKAFYVNKNKKTPRNVIKSNELISLFEYIEIIKH